MAALRSANILPMAAPVSEQGAGPLPNGLQFSAGCLSE